MTIKLFGENVLRDVFAGLLARVKAKIESESDEYVLRVNEEKYVGYLLEKFRIKPVAVEFDNVNVSTYESLIPAERHPKTYYVHSGRSYKRDVFRYHVPFSGDELQLRWNPSGSTGWTWPVIVESAEICFDIINFDLDDVQLRREWENRFKETQNQYNCLVTEIHSCNTALEHHVKEFLRSRKQHLEQKGTLLEKLGVPIKKRLNVPSTFAVPAPNKRTPIQVSKPHVAVPSTKPEPTLDEAIYNAILKIIQDVGKAFERMPSTYAGKEEEHLRDHILLMLEPNFEGSATGETFNKTGKTDILLRHEKSNVFVAECKFWHGEKIYLDTLSQLLGYLTWRDSKTAVIIFVRNKDLSSVLHTVRRVTTKHANFVKYVGEADETCFHYRFHLPQDPGREVRVAVMLFHIPEPAKTGRNDGP